MPNMKNPAKSTKAPKVAQPAPRPKPTMSDSHKEALAIGRTEGRAVRVYLEALRANGSARGRKRSAESITTRLAAIEAELAGADPVKELKLVQERLDLEQERAALGTTVDLSAIEAEFVKVAGLYSQRNGISYAAWRQVGVAPAILRRAGVSRTS